MLVYDRGPIKQLTSTPAISGGITQAMNTLPIMKFLADVHVAGQGHGLYIRVWTLLSESRKD